jgi:hypothetical protein
MRKNFDKEACPVCGSEDYTIEDYGDDFSGLDGAAQWWSCRCDKCGCRFDIERSYELVDLSVSRANGN